MSIAGVVADANVLLSAVTGRAALRVFTEYELSVHVAEFNVEEVLEYLPAMAARYGLDAVVLELQWKLLPTQIHPFAFYQSHFASAVGALSKRDPEDAHALALARRLRIPLWSNDRDLQGLDVQCHPTARLLAVLAREPREPP